MSKNRKRRLRNLTSAMIGALGMAGSVANLNTNAHETSTSTSTLTKAGIGTGIVSGLGLFALATYNTLKGPDPTDREYKEMRLKYEKNKMEEEEKERKRKEKKNELMDKYGIGDTITDNAAKTLNWIRGDSKLTGAQLLELCDDEEICDVIKAAGVGFNANSIDGALEAVKKHIMEKLTIEQIEQVCNALNETEDGKTTADNITAITVRTGNHNQTFETEMQKNTTGYDAAAHANNGNKAVAMLGTGANAATKAQIKAGNALLTNSLKKILGDKIAATIPVRQLSTIDGKVADAVGFFSRGGNAITRVDALKSWKRTDNTAAIGGAKALRTHLIGESGQLGMQIMLGKLVNYASPNDAAVQAHVAHPPANGYDANIKGITLITINDLNKDTCPNMEGSRLKKEANSKLFKAARSAIENA
jgi:hypothetical protein